jgi:putative oxidoreductase
MSHTTTLSRISQQPLATRVLETGATVYRQHNTLTPVCDMIIRQWVAKVFFMSGLTKIQSFDSTILLFQYEYSVPLLSPTMAAYLGTAAELTLPVFVALGPAERLSAVALFLFNIVAVISYPALNDAGVQQHQVWGIMLLVTICHGPGKLSLDHLIGKLLRQ